MVGLAPNSYDPVCTVRVITRQRRLPEAYKMFLEKWKVNSRVGQLKMGI